MGILEREWYRVTVGPSGRLYLFWHDERDAVPGAHAGAELYYTWSDGTPPQRFPNIKIANAMCECCRIAVDFGSDGEPVLLTRFIFGDHIRDHGLLRLEAASQTWKAQRVTYDDWHVHACPEHGPALSITENGSYHIAWFTLGDKRKGLFYAHSADRGKHFSEAIPFGNPESLPSHADVLAIGSRVVLTWIEYDGENTSIKTIQSQDHGEHWSATRTLLQTQGASDYPFLRRSGNDIFVSWNSTEEGYQLVKIP